MRSNSDPRPSSSAERMSALRLAIALLVSVGYERFLRGIQYTSTRTATVRATTRFPVQRRSDETALESTPKVGH